MLICIWTLIVVELRARLRKNEFLHPLGRLKQRADLQEDASLVLRLILEGSGERAIRSIVFIAIEFALENEASSHHSCCSCNHGELLLLAEGFRAKLFVIGKEGVGKTTLLKSINEPPSPDEKPEKTAERMKRASTVGIEIRECNIDEKMTVQSWDLGGQEVCVCSAIPLDDCIHSYIVLTSSFIAFLSSSDL